MYESQSQEYKYEIERLANELVNVKKKYLAQKRKEQQARYGKITVLTTQLPAQTRFFLDSASAFWSECGQIWLRWYNIVA